MTTRTAEFTANGNWTCPAGVSGVIVTMVGGGCGTPPGDEFRSSGGGGSAELMTAKMVSVVPNTVYPIVVGAKGLASVNNSVKPTGQGDSTFNGFIALKAGTFSTAGVYGANHSGGGGGVGGGLPDGGQRHRGLLESRHSTGGCSGGLGVAYSDISSVNGGVVAQQGSGIEGGGEGAGAIWGGTDGANTGSAGNDAAADHYGAGGGGTSGHAFIGGGDGATGYVLLMWCEP